MGFEESFCDILLENGWDLDFVVGFWCVKRILRTKRVSIENCKKVWKTEDKKIKIGHLIKTHSTIHSFIIEYRISCNINFSSKLHYENLRWTKTFVQKPLCPTHHKINHTIFLILCLTSKYPSGISASTPRGVKS